MKKLMVITISVCCAFALCFGAKVWADEKEKDAAKIPLENYLKGHVHGQSRIYPQGFSR
ncbi:MAG: hypothetical protein M3R14_11570 [Acidobacteriota bacterium]|nr:hypothetical protein [Acidobacteriota bacterium]